MGKRFEGAADASACDHERKANLGDFHERRNGKA